MLLLLVCDFADILQSKINDSFVFMMRNTILVHPVGTNDPFLHHKLLLREYSLGNCLGHYLEAYSCAMVANIGFNLEIVPHERLSNCTLKIISMLPTNPHPTTIVSDYQESKLQQICSCHKYCWETSNSAWFHALDTIHQILKRAFNTIPFYRCTDHKVENATRPDIQTWNKKYGVTIQYRCSDILSLKEKKYGFVNFHVYSFLIPSNTKEVMILSDHPNRSHEGAICGSIIDALGAFLQVEFPLASIQVQRGGKTKLEFTFHIVLDFSSRLV